MRISRIILPVLSLLMLSAIPSFGQDGYSNPILPGFHPDPSICAVGEDFYLVNSTFQYYPGVPVYHSRDLVSWEQIGSCLVRTSQSDLSGALSWGGIYAPTIRYHDGTFYMIVTNCSHGGNFIVTAKDPAGPWSEPVYVNTPGIDPSLYFEGDRCYYTGSANDAIVFCEIDVRTGELLSELKPIWKGTGGRYPEGPHIYFKDGWYYLLIAEGGTEFGHKITVARSRSIDGPYEGNPANPILTHFCQAGQTSPIQGLGHGDFVQGPDGSWWMVCLGFRTQGGNHHLMGRETFLAPVQWKEGEWPVVNEGKILSEHMTCPTLPSKGEVKGTARHLSFVTGDRLGIDWLYLRNPDLGRYTYSPYGLSLMPSIWTLSETTESPTFAGYRQSDIFFTSSATVSLEEGAAAGDESGISLYMDAPSHYDFFVTRKDDGSYSVGVRYRLGELTHEEFFPVEGGSAKLEIEASDYSYAFYYTPLKAEKVNGMLVSKEGDRVKAGSINTCYISSETASGFTGVIIGLYAVSPKDSGKPAHVMEFTYTPKGK